MAKCCGSTCACKMVALDDLAGNAALEVAGTGTMQDPFTFRFLGTVADADPNGDVLLVVDFDPSRGYVLTPSFAPTSKLDHLGDVAAPAPSNGYVLGYNSGTGKWQPQAPTSAAPSSVHTDSSLSGDGSTGAPLNVRHDPDGGTTTGPAGVKLTALALSELTLRFSDATARATAIPAPTLNQLTMLDSNPGQVQFWDGTAWSNVEVFSGITYDTPLLQLSGPPDGSNFVLYTGLVTGSTDNLGRIVLLDAADLLSLGASGVISASFTAQVGVSTEVPCIVIIDGSDDTQLAGIAYALDGTGPIDTQNIRGSLTAVLY